MELTMQQALLITNVLIILGLLTLAAFLKYYFPSYLKEKAKNLATKEDVSQITHEMEKVKATYTKDLESYRSDLWLRQQKLLWEREEHRIKVRIFQKSTKLLNLLNSQIQNHHIFASSRDIAWAVAVTRSPIDQEARNFYRNEHKSFRRKAETSYLEFRSLSFELGQLAALLSVYFGDEFYNLALSIRDKGNKAIASPLTRAEIAAAVEEALAQEEDLNAVTKLIGEKYDATYNHLIPKQDAQDFFELMHKTMQALRAGQ